MKNNAEQMTLAVRRQQLLLDGVAFRIGIVHAKARVAQSLHPDALMHSAVESTKEFATAKVAAILGSTEGRAHAIQTLIPFAFSACATLSRKNIFRLTLAAIVTGAAAVIVSKWHKNKTSHFLASEN